MELHKNPLFISIITILVGIITTLVGAYVAFVVRSIRRELKFCRESCRRELDDIKHEQGKQEDRIIELYKEKKGN